MISKNYKSNSIVPKSLNFSDHSYVPIQMWKAESMLSHFFRGTENVIELVAVGRTSPQTFPYDEVGLVWHRRPRVMYEVPNHILARYIPLSSATFQTICLHKMQHTSASNSAIHVMGEIGMGFALDEYRYPRMSVEAAALYQLVQTPSSPTQVPNSFFELEKNWTSQMSLFMFDTTTGWRGCFAEHRLWSSLILQKNKQATDLKTPYASPTIRSWFPPEILNDFEDCVGSELAWDVAMTVSELGYDGAPDLVLYHNNPPSIWFVEVKSATDRLKEHQIKMLEALSRIPSVKCQICCPKNALKRFARSFHTSEDSNDSEYKSDD